MGVVEGDDERTLGNESASELDFKTIWRGMRKEMLLVELERVGRKQSRASKPEILL